MSSRNDRFNANMTSLDAFIDTFEDPSKIAVLSDNGESVERMLNQIDPPAETEHSEDSLSIERQRKLHTAEMRLYRAGFDYLVPTLRLIATNGSNRKESIWSMMKSK